jgi:glutaredoxin
MKGCPHCHEFKEMLNNENIEYIDADIEDHSEEYEMFVQITENDFVPAIMLVDEENSKNKFYAPDRDFEDLEQGVELIKKYIQE